MRFSRQEYWSGVPLPKMSSFKSVRDCKGKMRVAERKNKERWGKREKRAWNIFEDNN